MSEEKKEEITVKDFIEILKEYNPNLVVAKNNTSIVDWDGFVSPIKRDSLIEREERGKKYLLIATCIQH